MRKVVARPAGLIAAVVVLLCVLVGPVLAAAGASAVTRALVVGSLAFVLMIGAAGAVLWYAARHRGTAE